MNTYSVKQAQANFDDILREAQYGGVIIEIAGRSAVLLTTIEHCVDCKRDHWAKDLINQKIACEVLSQYGLDEIRKRSMENIASQRSQEAFGTAYADWLVILSDMNDSKLIAAMVGNCDQSNQLRQFMPFVGMLIQDELDKIRASVHDLFRR